MVFKNKIIEFTKEADKKILSMAFITMLMTAYYINPLDNIDLTDWNRTFCPAVESGISINKRINNFYVLFLLYMPLLFAGITVVYNWICNIRPTYKESFFRFNAMMIFAIAASYISRYTSGNGTISESPMLHAILGFYIAFLLVAIIDRQQKLNFTNHVNMFLRYTIAVLSINMLFHFGYTTSVVVSAAAIFLYEAITLYCIKSEGLKNICEKWFCFFSWTPAFIRGLLEIIYIRTENGGTIQAYFTYITGFTILALVTATLPAIIAVKKNLNLNTFAHIGEIFSMGAVSWFNNMYQSTWSYQSAANIYELGNSAVALDTIGKGKLPIIDYFSAHALSDVLTKILYGFIHRDINGIVVGAYDGLTTILGIVCLYLIIKRILNGDVAILFVCLFPTAINGVKLTDICFFSMAILLYIIKKPGFKAYVLYWTILLFCAFYKYDEGVLLGVGSIAAYGLICLIQKEWKNIRDFIVSGGIIGVIALLFYVIYALVTGVPVISRVREWVAVSVNSNSTWATSSFGDTSSFAFLLSYFAAPTIAVMIIVLTTARFYRYKKSPELAALTLGFAFSEILFIPRTIVFHNLAVSSGVTGVLLNFIHWSLSLYVLYSMTEKNEERKLLAWVVTLGLTIILEGSLVTGQLPASEAVLYASSISASQNWDLRDDVTENIGEKRIVFDDETEAYVGRFKYIFDTLLTEEQTFVDFANITSLYALTGRERPSYVGQTPSQLTDLYSQECYLKEISEYDCPLAVVGTTETSYLQQMEGIPHNIRYYKIAEYIYNRYRPLVSFDEYSIWCQKDKYYEYNTVLLNTLSTNIEFELVDYGYDATTEYTDEAGTVQMVFMPYHNYDLGMLPYIWGNYDEYGAINNKNLAQLDETQTNVFVFAGSQSVVTPEGNYVVLECENSTDHNVKVTAVFQDLSNSGATHQYGFIVVPGTNTYSIRASQDYFWDIYNIDRISVISASGVEIHNINILEGD
ncbi:MAG: hypothetical protein NC337_02955 [Roseburia sp.]|nr:hypothetical protein [Roseburia sp.]